MAVKVVNANAKVQFVFAILAICFAVFTVSAYASDSFVILPYKEGDKKSVEHGMRPKPTRTYWLNTSDISEQVEGYLVRADGVEKELNVAVEDRNASVNFNLPMGDGPAHGANHVYITEQQVVDEMLVVRSAKYLSLQHSCSWGHDYKYDKRVIPKAFGKAPLEFVCEGVWDENFHYALNAGDDLKCRVVSFGKPVQGAKVKLVTENGWSKSQVSGEDGSVTYGLIRDYYPKKWENFDTRKVTPIFLSAEFVSNESGELQGKKYENIKYTTTLGLKYSPSSRDYNSYSYGLLVGLLFTVGPAWIVYRYREKRKRPMKEILFNEKD